MAAPETNTNLVCAIELIVKAVDKCAFVTSNCNSANYVDFYRLKYCTLAKLPGQYYLFWGVSCLIVMMSFYFLGNIAEKFLSNSLSLMSKRLGLSEAVAGVTVLAFANGAPDIIASFTAGGEEDTGVFISIGSLFGGCLFASTIVLGLCVLYSKTGIYMEESSWLRDIFFYIGSALLILIYGFIGKINLWMAVGFFGLYIGYLITVIVQANMEKATDLPLDKQTAKMAKVSKAHLKYAINKYMQSEPEPEPTPTDMGMKVYLGVQADEEQADGEEMDETSFQKQTRDEELEPEGHTGRVDTYADTAKEMISMNEIKTILKAEKRRILRELRDKSLFGAVMVFIDVIFDTLFSLLIPQFNEDGSPKGFVRATPLLCILSLASLLDLWKVSLFDGKLPIVVILAALSIYLGLAARRIQLGIQDPSNFVFWCLMTLGIISSICWLSVAAGTIVDLIEFISLVLELNPVFLGATLMAIGNSLGDLYNNSSLASIGFGVMACTGTISGQLFNLLIGFGLNLVRQTLNSKTGTVDFNLFSPEKSEHTSAVFTLIVLGFSLTVLCIIAVVSYKNRYALPKKFAAVLVICYSLVVPGGIAFYFLTKN